MSTGRLGSAGAAPDDSAPAPEEARDAAAEVAAPGAPPQKECVDCHREPEEQLVFRDGTRMDLAVDFDAWNATLHGKELQCVDCHRRASTIPHAEASFADAREYRVYSSKTCRRCHYAFYSKNLDSIHTELIRAGNDLAPTCVDCHGAHEAVAPSARIAVHRRCASCHREISEAYAMSVHGRHLIKEDNQDVPVCTDCHGAHGIRDPRTALFHAHAHEICARCHSDAERMGRYGLSTNVLSSYLEDFHGHSNQLYAEGAGRPDRPLASCIDCHGTHDVHALSGNRAAIRERVALVCRRCHQNVPDAFADAWLSHYAPTLASAPIVWTTKWTFHILYLLLLGGLALHVLLHLWCRRVRPPHTD